MQRKDPTEFRRRFQAYKEGKMPYENGLPKYEDGTPAYQTFVEEMGPILYKEAVSQGVANPDVAYRNMLTQLAYESNYGTSSVARKQNNYGGVGWNGKTYTTYKDKEDFARNYVRLMNSRYKNVIGADTLSDYAKGLKKLGYYEDTLENYSRNLTNMKSFARAMDDHFANNKSLYLHAPVQTPVIQRVEPAVSTAVRKTIPQTQARARWTGAEKVSPYVTGKPMVKLNPIIKLPTLEQIMDDAEWEPEYNLPGFKKGKLPGFEDGTEGFAPNVFRRSNGQYFYKNGDSEIDLQPIMTSLSDDPATWTYVDAAGKKYTPKRQIDNGVITEDTRSSGESFWDNYVGELKYDIANNRVIGGKYTMPAIAAGALGGLLAGAIGSSSAYPALNEAVGLVGKNIWRDAAKNFAWSMFGGSAVDKASQLYTGQSWGKNINSISEGWIPEFVGDFINPGYLLSGESVNTASNFATQFAKNFPKQLHYLGKQITAEKRAKHLADEMKAFYGLQNENYAQQIKDIGEQLSDLRKQNYEIGDDYYKLLQDYKNAIKATAQGNAEYNFTEAENIMNTLLTKLKMKPDVKESFVKIGKQKLLPKRFYERIKNSDAADKMQQLLDENYINTPDFSKMSIFDIVHFINKNAPTKMRFNFSKSDTPENITSIPGVEAFADLNIGTGKSNDVDIALKMLLENGGYKLSPQGYLLSEKDVIPLDQIFKTGQFSIPKFGTDYTVDGMISVQNPGRSVEINPEDVIRSISDKKIVPRQIDHGAERYSAEIPEQFENVLKHNIEYLKEMFPGAKPFGSSTTSAYAGTPHATHDIDLLMSDTDFVSQVEKKLGGRTGSGWSVSSKPNNTGFEDTYTHSLGEQYGDAGNIDFNIIYTDPNTGMASSTMGTRGLELFKQFFPADYRSAVMESMRTGNPIVINKTPKELIDAYDPVTKTILDSFSSNKIKHVPRAEAHLTTTDPQYVSKALDLYAQEKLGGQAQRIPTTREMFTDVQSNRRIFDELGYKGVDKETVVNDPDKMKNLVDYWYYHNSIFGRGVSSGTLIKTDPNKDAMSYIDNAFREWIGAGGNANGAGLNTVTLGDTGYGDVYGYIQPKLSFDESQTAEQLIQSAKRQLGYYSYQFTDAEKQQIVEILRKHGQLINPDNIDTPQELLKSMFSDTHSSKEALQEISDNLGIRALSKEALFGNSGRYNSMTGNVEQTDALMYSPRSLQESPVSDVIRDRQTAQQATRSEDDLKQEIQQIAKRRWDSVRKQLFDQNRLYRKEKSLEPIRVGRKYDDMSDEQFDKLAKIKIRRTNKELMDKKEQIDQQISNLESKNESNLESKINAERRLEKANDVYNKAYNIKRKRKDAIQYMTGAAVVAAPILTTLGVIHHINKVNQEFIKSEEYLQMLKDPEYEKAINSPDDSFERLERKYKRKYERRVRNKTK